ncbi:hypothetical protein D3C80_1671490 [compost metagenome]
MRITLGRIQGGDNDVIAPRIGFFLGDGVNSELGIKLADPLQHKRSGDENQYLAHQTAYQILFQYQAGFNRLAKPHLISKNGPAGHFKQYFMGSIQLMGQRGQAGQMLRAL